jgi:hypothetical protein
MLTAIDPAYSLLDRSTSSNTMTPLVNDVERLSLNSPHVQHPMLDHGRKRVTFNKVSKAESRLIAIASVGGSNLC